jgi:hypothetical protein
MSLHHPSRGVGRTTTSAILAVALQQACAADPVDLPPQADGKTLMCERGTLLFSDDFTATTMVKNWGDANLAGFSFVDQAMRVTAQPNVHPPMRFHSLSATDVIVQAELKLDGVDWISLGWDSKQAPSPGHMERFSLRPGGLDMHREGGLGGDRSKDTIDRMATTISTGRWHVLVWEIHGTERLASLDAKQILYGKADGIDIPRSSLWLEIASNPGKYAWFAHLRVWQATVKPDWESRGRQLVLDYLKKRS